MCSKSRVKILGPNSTNRAQHSDIREFTASSPPQLVHVLKKTKKNMVHYIRENSIRLPKKNRKQDQNQPKSYTAVYYCSAMIAIHQPIDTTIVYLAS